LFVLTASEIGVLFIHLFGLRWDNYCVTFCLGCPKNYCYNAEFFLD